VDYPKNCPFETKSSILNCQWKNILEDLTVLTQTKTDSTKPNVTIGAIVLIINTIIALVEALIKLLNSLADVLEKVRKVKEEHKGGNKKW